MTADEFNIKLLDKLDDMNKNLATMNERLTVFEGKTDKALTSLSGKMKGNHDLLKSEIQSYVQKDTCENLRMKQGERIGDITKEFAVLKSSVEDHLKNNKSNIAAGTEMLITWLPGLLKVVAIVGGFLLALANGWIKFGG